MLGSKMQWRWIHPWCPDETCCLCTWNARLMQDLNRDLQTRLKHRPVIKKITTPRIWMLPLLHPESWKRNLGQGFSGCLGVKSWQFQGICPACCQSFKHLNAAGILALKTLSPLPCFQHRDSLNLPGRITVPSTLRSLGGWCCWQKVQAGHEFQIVLHVEQSRQHSPRAPLRRASPPPTSDCGDKIRSTNWSVRSAAPFLRASYSSCCVTQKAWQEAAPR